MTRVIVQGSSGFQSAQVPQAHVVMPRPTQVMDKVDYDKAGCRWGQIFDGGALINSSP